MAEVVKYNPLTSPVGPTENIVPQFFLQSIPEEILECYVVSNNEDSENLPAGSSVIIRSYTASIYHKIASNLTSSRRFASMKIHPWIFNVLVDHADVDQIACTDQNQTNEIMLQGRYDDNSSSGSANSPSCSRDSSSPGSPLSELGNSFSEAGNSSTHDQNEVVSEENFSFYHWSHSATKLFISHLQENQETFLSPGTKKKGLWVLLSQNMKGSGDIVTPEQCKNKWTSPKSNFKRIEDHNKVNGNDNTTYKFYDELYELLGGKPNIYPLKVISMAKAAEEVPTTTNTTEEKQNATASTEVNEKPVPKESKQKRKRSDTTENVLTLLNTIKEDAQKEREERRKREVERFLCRNVFPSKVNSRKKVTDRNQSYCLHIY